MHVRRRGKSAHGVGGAVGATDQTGGELGVKGAARREPGFETVLLVADEVEDDHGVSRKWWCPVRETWTI